MLAPRTGNTLPREGCLLQNFSIFLTCHDRQDDGGNDKAILSLLVFPAGLHLDLQDGPLEVNGDDDDGLRAPAWFVDGSRQETCQRWTKS